MADIHSCVLEEANSYRCGSCDSFFPTICHLYKHFICHDSGGSFHFDNMLKVGFPKYDSACIAIQTDMSFIHESDIKLLFLLTKYRHRLPHLFPDLKIPEDESATTLSKRATTGNVNVRDTCIRDVQTKSKERKKLSQRKLISVDFTSSLITDDSQQNDADEVLSELCHRKNTNTIDFPEANETVMKGNNVAVADKEVNLHKFKSLVEEHKADIPQRSTGNSENDTQGNNNSKIDSNSLIDKGHSKPTEVNLKETYDMKEKNADISNKYKIQSNNHTLSFYELNKTSSHVKVSQTWIPANDVPRDQQEQTQASFKAPGASIPETQIENKDQTQQGSKETKTNSVRCEICGKILSKKSYKSHRNIHLDRSPYVCEFCGKKFSSNTGLGLHKASHHLEDGCKLQCKFCNKTFPVRSRLSEHVLTHTKDKQFVCVTCGSVFYSKRALRKHIGHVHEERNKVYYCTVPECNKKYNFIAHRNEHVRSHTQVFTCDVCGASFNRQSSRKRHMMIHSGKKDHKCHICGHEFIQKMPYWVHMEKHHDLTKAQLMEQFPEQHGGQKYTLPESVKQLEIEMEGDEDAV